MRIIPHLIFDGQCREAFVAYQRILGGKLATLMTFGESPLAASVDAKWHSRILHATLDLDGAELNGADVLPHDYQRPQGFSVILSVGERGTRAPDVRRARGGRQGEHAVSVHVLVARLRRARRSFRDAVGDQQRSVALLDFAKGVRPAQGFDLQGRIGWRPSQNVGAACTERFSTDVAIIRRNWFARLTNAARVHAMICV